MPTLATRFPFGQITIQAAVPKRQIKERDLDELGPSDYELEELVKHFPAPSEWYNEDQ